MSYLGKIQIGLIGDLDVVPDLSRVATFLDESFQELRTAAESRR